MGTWAAAAAAAASAALWLGLAHIAGFCAEIGMKIRQASCGTPMMIRFKMDPHAISTMHDGVRMPIASMVADIHHVLGADCSPRTS